jgi:hypothetical protein
MSLGRIALFFIGVLAEDHQNLTDGKSLFIPDMELRPWDAFSQITAMTDGVLGKGPPTGAHDQVFCLVVNIARCKELSFRRWHTFTYYVIYIHVLFKRFWQHTHIYGLSHCIPRLILCSSCKTDSLAFEDGTECSETLATKLHTPENIPKENIRQDSLYFIVPEQGSNSLLIGAAEYRQNLRQLFRNCDSREQKIALSSGCYKNWITHINHKQIYQICC